MKFSPSSSYRQELCTGCGICMKVCPVSAISLLIDGRITSFSSLCIGCGHCGCYCPENCFGLEPIGNGHNTSPEEAISQLIKSRRSTRIFTSEEISQEILEALLEPVGFSPTGHNDQGIEVKVISGRGRVRAVITDPLIRLIKILDSFRLLTLLAGPGRNFIKRLKAGEDLITWEAPCVLLFKAPLKNATGSADAVIAATLVSVKAETMGLGSLWNGIVRIASPLLGLGRASAVLCIGFPGLKKYQRVSERDWKRTDI